MKSSIRMLLFVIAAIYPMISSATNGITCNGVVTAIGVYGTDHIELKLDVMNTRVRICNLNQTLGVTNPISPEQCRAVYGMLLAAYMTVEPVRVLFDNVQTGISCTTFVKRELATARYVGLGD